MYIHIYTYTYTYIKIICAYRRYIWLYMYMLIHTCTIHSKDLRDLWHCSTEAGILCGHEQQNS